MAEQAEERHFASALRRLLASSRAQAPEASPAMALGQAGDAVVLLCACEGGSAGACAREAGAHAMISSAAGCALGLAAAVAGGCARGAHGAVLSIDALAAAEDAEAALFRPRVSDMLVSLPKERLAELHALAARHAATAICLGMVGGDRLLICDAAEVLLEVPVAELACPCHQEGS